MHVAVVAAGNGIAEARALARSVTRHHPDWPVTVVVLAGLRPELHKGSEPFDVLVPGDLEAGAWVDSAPPAAVIAALRALLVSHLLERGAEAVLALPSDAMLYAPLTALDLETHEALFVPRLLGTLPDDGNRPDGRDLVEAGELDDAIVAVRAGAPFASWWVERALEAAETGRPANPFPAAFKVFPSLGRIEDPSYGLSYWNLHERALDAPVLMRWDGFRPDRPWWLSEHATRTLVLDDARLTALVGERVEALRAGGWIRLDGLASGAGELPNGLRYDARLQALHAQATDAGEDFGDVFSPAGAEAFESWLLEPAPVGAAGGLNRYAHDVWRGRPDVQEAYADLDGPDLDGFLGWLWVHGRPEMALQGELLPKPPEGVADVEDHVPAVLVAGYLRGNLGLGEAGRGYVRALRHGGVPVATRSISVDPPVDRLPRGARPRPEEREFEDLTLPEGVEPEITLLGVNADQTPGLLEELEEPRGDYTIGLWAWETDRIPERWDAAFDLVDELWVYSTYIAENLSRAADVPVIVMPLPVEAPDPGGETVPFTIPDGFVFLFAFDFFSTLERKNPLGLVEAFKQAFAPGEGPTLLLKTINADFRPAERERLRYAIGDRPDILLVDRALSPGEMAALFTRADCYVSLHRAEGYGLTPAESMALGKPVIATGFSGNTDFMTPANSYLVDWELTDVGPDAEHYPADGTWAEPSLEHAAALMREVYEHQDEARARGARAAAEIAATLSVAEVARKARQRLMRIAARRRALPTADSAPHTELAHRLQFDLSGQRDGVTGARGAVRRGVFRAMAPYTTSQRQLDLAVAQTLQRMHVELEAERAALGRERLRAARRDRRAAELAERLAAVERRLERVGQLELPTARAVRRLQDAAEAIPYTEDEPFTVFDHPVAGRVQGFRRDAAADVDAGEAYRAFEDVFRGSRERVRALAEPYVELLEGPVLDVGCGRGELLELLREAGIDARGVDLDAGMAEEARALGLDVTVADALDYLAGLEDDSLGSIISMQVIEHIPRESLARFFALGRAKLRPGGTFIAETVNPHAGHALKTFWVDLTHQHPVFPEVALALAGDAGFREGFITHLAGARDVDADRFAESSYAVVATA